MVKEFIKPVNKQRKLLDYLHHYLVKPPLVYRRDTPPSAQPSKRRASVNAPLASEASASALASTAQTVTELPIAQAAGDPTTTEPSALAQAAVVTSTEKSSTAAPDNGAVATEPPPQVAPVKTNAQENSASKRPRLKIKAKPQPKPYIEKPYKINFSALLKRAFIITFGVEGFEHTTSKTVFAENDSGPRKLKHSYQSESFGAGLLIASFFGLPTRTKQTAAAEQQPLHTFTFGQFLKNMVGGWDNLYEEVQNPNASNIELHPLATTNTSGSLSPLTTNVEEPHDFHASSTPAEQLDDANNRSLASPPKTRVEEDGEESQAANKRTWKLVWSEKKIWQVVLFFPFKFPIIFAFKLLGIVLKTALNIVKLFTEFLPQIITNIIATGFYNATEKLRFIASKNIHPFNKAAQLFGFGLVTLALGVVNYTCRILTMILRAATSPEKSARMAYAAGREYNFESRSREEFDTFSKAFGILAAAISISISVVTWTLALPLVIGALMTYLPVYLPTVFQTLSTFAQLPFVAKSLAVLNTTLSPVANTLLNAAGPVLSTVSTFLGVQIPSLALILGTAIGALAAPLTAIASRIADELSNTWVALHNKGHGPLNYIGAWFSRRYIAIKNWRNPPQTSMVLLGDSNEAKQPPKPSQKQRRASTGSLKLVSETAKALDHAQDAAQFTGRQLAAQGAVESNAPSIEPESDKYNFEYCGNSPDFQLLVTAANSSNNKAKEAIRWVHEYKLADKVHIEGSHYEFRFTAEVQEYLTQLEEMMPNKIRDNDIKLRAIIAAIKEVVSQKKRAANTTVLAANPAKL